MHGGVEPSQVDGGLKTERNDQRLFLKDEAFRKFARFGSPDILATNRILIDSTAHLFIFFSFSVSSPPASLIVLVIVRRG